MSGSEANKEGSVSDILRSDADLNYPRASDSDKINKMHVLKTL